MTTYDEELQLLKKQLAAEPDNRFVEARIALLEARGGFEIPSSHKGVYRLIMSDPAWRYQNWSDSANGAAKAHYDGMTFEEMAKIPVDAWAHPKGCVHIMWCTWPKIDEGVDLMRAWGFEIVTGMPWVKTTRDALSIKRGPGFWFAGASEFVIVGVRGKFKRRSDWETKIGLLHGDNRQFYAPIGRHSAKHERFQDFLDEHFDGPRLELFARRERPGWTCWGTDIGYLLTEKGVERCAPQAYVSSQRTLFDEHS